MCSKLKRLSVSSTIKRNPEQLFSLIDNEVVMLNIQNSEYYGLNETGSFIWNTISNPMKIKDLIDILTIEFDVELSICIEETLDFLNNFASTGAILIERE